MEGDGDRLVGLHWMPIGGHAPRFEGTMATPGQLSALRRVDALLTDLWFEPYFPDGHYTCSTCRVRSSAPGGALRRARVCGNVS